MLNRDQIMAAELKQVEVEVPEWGGTVMLQEPRADDAVTLQQEMKKIKEAESEPALRELAIVFCAVGENGERLFTSDENRGQYDVVVVDRALAARAWPGESPIDKELFAAGFFGSSDRWFRVVGVVEPVHIDDPLRIARETIFFPHGSQGGVNSMSVIIRSTSEGPDKIAGAIREIVTELDPQTPLSAVRPLSAYVSDATAPVRFATGLIGLFALVALILAAIGVYGVVSSAVRQSTREIGLRLALGAPHPRLVTSIVARGVRLAVLGLGAGLLVSLGLARLMSGLLTEVSPTDTFTYMVVALLLLVITIAASLAPAWRATRIDPMDALRYE